MITVRTPRFRSHVDPNLNVGQSVNLGRYDLNFGGNWIHLAGYPETGMHPVGCPSTAAWPPYFKAMACADELHPGPPYLTGGPFRKIKIEHAKTSTVGHGTYESGTQQFSFSGVGFGPIRYIGGYSNPSFPGDLIDVINLKQALTTEYLVPAISDLGDKAWDKTKPRIEHAGLGVALAELRDVPTMLRTSSKGFDSIWRLSDLFLGAKKESKKRFAKEFMAPKKAADHFLNHNFGWVPFIKDLTSFIDLVISSDDAIKRIKRDNGKWIRRRATLVNDYRETKISSGDGIMVEPYGSLQEGLLSSTAKWEVWEQKTTLATSVGSFAYYRPEFDDSLTGDSIPLLRDLRRQLAIHGARISPSNIYKATPWTWLIDWVSNAGHWVSQGSDYLMDGMVARYLYLHHYSLRRHVLKQHMPFKSGAKTLEFTRLIEVKQRKGAETPYGFGLSWDNLSPKQIAILGALGITRT
jgi:hypothetical protein